MLFSWCRCHMLAFSDDGMILSIRVHSARCTTFILYLLLLFPLSSIISKNYVLVPVLLLLHSVCLILGPASHGFTSPIVIMVLIWLPFKRNERSEIACHKWNKRIFLPNQCKHCTCWESYTILRSLMFWYLQCYWPDICSFFHSACGLVQVTCPRKLHAIFLL